MNRISLYLCTMTRKFRLAVAILLTGLYGLAMGSAYQQVGHAGATFSSDAQQVVMLTDFAHQLFCLTSTPEGTTGHHSCPADPDSASGQGILRLTEQRYEAAFLQYIALSDPGRKAHTKSDQLFPFHNFW